MEVLNINVGILGHVDSGKTSLVKALSTVLSTASLDKSPQVRYELKMRPQPHCAHFNKPEIGGSMHAEGVGTCAEQHLATEFIDIWLSDGMISTHDCFSPLFFIAVLTAFSSIAIGFLPTSSPSANGNETFHIIVCTGRKLRGQTRLLLTGLYVFDG